MSDGSSYRRGDPPETALKAVCVDSDQFNILTDGMRQIRFSPRSIEPVRRTEAGAESTVHHVWFANFMPRFYIPPPLTVGSLLTLPEQVAHHVHVLRLPLGATLTLFDGSGEDTIATITALEKKRVTVEIKMLQSRSVELPYAITLAQGLPEAAKMDWIIEKAVELGAAGIVPLTAQRCVVRLSVERAEKRAAHWQAVIVAASEQCGRNRLARLAPLVDFNSWIGQQDLHRRILLTPRAEQSLADWSRHQPPQAVTLMIGPEGGFSPDEERSAIQHGALPLAMGPRVLRTETAGLAALATLVAAWGES